MAGQETLSLQQSFSVETNAKDTLDAAAEYLEGIGHVAPALQGRMERFGDAVAIHHGRIETRVAATEESGRTRVEIHRHGQAPLEDTRRWLLAVGLGGFLLAWLLTFYNEKRIDALHPLVTILLFLMGLVATVAVLYVADRSLERRSAGIVLAVEDAIQSDPVLVLRREIDALERSSSLANGFLFYCGGLVINFVIYAILWSPDVVQDIDQAVALTTMRFVFLLPILPALAFAGIYFMAQNKAHKERLTVFESRR